MMYLQGMCLRWQRPKKLDWDRQILRITIFLRLVKLLEFVELVELVKLG